MSRSGLSFLGIDAKHVTVKPHSGIVSAVAAANAAAVEGKAVTITGNGEAGYGSAGDALFGKITKYEDSAAMTVQYGGFAELTGISAALPTAGDYVVVDGSGAVSASATATNARVISVSDDAVTGPVVVLLS
jgi:hypothetical protein